MANIKSAQKRAKTNEERKLRNNSRKSDVKTATKKVIAAIANNDLAQAKELLKIAEAKISRAEGKGTFKKNTASRKISRLALKVAAAA